MFHFAANRRAPLVAGAALCAVVVATATTCGGNDDQRTPPERAQLVLQDAAARRPCTERQDFTVYTLGERFNGEYATRLGARCEPHAHEINVFYGPCREGGESGCGNDISVESAPACERPYALYTNRPKLLTLRGVPASIFEERIELWTRDTTIIIFADPEVARRAVDALRPAGRATSSGASLAKPAEDIAARMLSDVRCRA